MKFSIVTSCFNEIDTISHFWHSQANRLLTPLLNVFNNLNLADIEVYYKAFRKKIPEQIQIVENSFGPETSNFPQPLQVEHFDDAGFIVSSNNYCVDYDESKISLTEISLDPLLTDVLGGTGTFFMGKTREIELEAPGAGNRGSIAVSYDIYDWLKFDWDDDGVHDNNPSAIATFGLYRGNDRIIYMREISN